MKNLAMVLAFLFVASSLMVQLAQAAPAKSLTPVEAKLALSTIDYLCADTWCEGDYRYEFKKISCDFKEGACRIDFTMTYDSVGSKSPDDYRWGVIRTDSVYCVIKGMRSAKSLFETNGVYTQLTPQAYDKINGCISELEAKLRF